MVGMDAKIELRNSVLSARLYHIYIYIYRERERGRECDVNI